MEEEKEKIEKGYVESDESEAMEARHTFATSFAELEDEEMGRNVQKLSRQFLALTANIINGPDVEDKGMAIEGLLNEYNERVTMLTTKERAQPLTDFMKNIFANITKAAMKTEGGIQYPAEDFAYVPDPEKPSGWKLRMSEGAPGNITIAQLGRAAAAFSPGGFRGQKVQVPAADIAAVKRRIRSEYRKLGVEMADMPAAVKQAKNAFAIKAMDDGTYRWTAIYSNKFRDEDVIPEIISDASHRRFADMVDNKETPYPELWYWHNKDWKIGQADFIAYDDNGFSIASGTFDNPEVAKAMEANPKLCDGVSHGMPGEYIKRDKEDSTIITEHITVEISPLPLAAAANKLTTFSVLDKEVNKMAVTQEKRDAAKKLGIDIEEVEQVAESKAQQAQTLALESKEKEAPEAEAADTGDGTTQVEQVTRQELEEVIGAMGKAIGSLTETVEALANEVKSLKQADSDKIKAQVANTPAASLGAIFQSAIGQQSTKMDGRTKEAKDGPKETAADTGPAIPGILGHIARVNQEKLGREVQ